MSDKAQDQKVVFTVYGTFACRAPDGRDLTPKSSKGQALLALLLTEKSHKRSRLWLQDRLWSRSQADRGAASLRQALRQIRQAFKPWDSLLCSNRKAVWLDMDQIASDWPAKTPTQEFLDGLDVDDPEFDAWIRAIRSNHLGVGPCQIQSIAPIQPVRHTRWQVALSEPVFTSHVGVVLESSFHALLTQSLLETEIADVCSVSDQLPGRETITVQATTQALDSAKVGFRILVMRPHTNRILHSNLKFLGASTTQVDANRELIPLIHSVQSAINEEIARHARSDNASLLEPIPMASLSRRVFSFSNQALQSVDLQMQQFCEGPETAAALGWRTQVAVIRDIEGLAENYQENAEQGLELAKRALEANTMNSIVLSAAANAHTFLNWDITTGAELAELAIRANSANPLSWWSYANSALYFGKSEKALQASRFASKLAEKSPIRFWCDFQHGLAAMQCGDLELAKRSWESSAALAPSFRPPRRYLLALYAHLGETQRARRMMSELSALEHDFSLDRIIADDDYPVSLARKFGLLDPEAFKAALLP